MRLIPVYKVNEDNRFRFNLTDRLSQMWNDPNTGLMITSWVDMKTYFFKGLLEAGQVRNIVTDTDLMGHDDYIDALIKGKARRNEYDNQITIFIIRGSRSQASFGKACGVHGKWLGASDLRINEAANKLRAAGFRVVDSLTFTEVKKLKVK